MFSVSYLNDLILIVRTMKQMGLNIAINGGSGGFVIPDFYKNVGKSPKDCSASRTGTTTSTTTRRR